MSEIRYRADIDGLRAFAVLPVILFHAGASWLPGGFVGVDVFFVISGYLISTIIIRDVTARKFSFKRFYERRIRRIIPALLFMVLVTVVVFQFIGLPHQSLNAAESGLAALLSFSNFYFWSASGYFSPAAEFMPLLHTWSLGVEEQFYILFPVALIAAYRLNLSLGLVLFLGLVVSFFASVWLSFNKPSAAYYLLPSRAWELAIGAVLASGVVPAVKNKIMKEILPAIGLLVLLLSFLLINSAMAFPGWVAIAPCLGAALIIHGDGNSWIARKVLMQKSIVFIGLLSYSLYLWHWPVLASFRVMNADLYLSFQLSVLAIIVTFVIAWLSWRLIETPFRNRGLISVKQNYSILGAGSLMVVVLASVSTFYVGFPDKLDASARKALVGAEDVDPYRRICSSFDKRENCRFGSSDIPVTYAIIGDSHAAAIRPAIEESLLLEGRAGTLYWKGACPFLEGAKTVIQPEKNECSDFREKVWSEIENESEIDTVILAGRWSFQLTGLLPETGGGYRVFLEDEDTVKPSVEENSRVVQRSITKTVERLTKNNIRVIIIGSVPEPGFNVPYSIAMARHNDADEPPAIPKSKVLSRAGESDKFFEDKITAEFSFISIWEAFCDETSCDVERDGSPLYYDDDHLSRFGAVSVVAQFINKQIQSKSIFTKQDMDSSHAHL